MSLSEKVQQLNSEIGSAMEHALDQVRQEVSQWLRSSNEEILGRLAQLKADIPESFVAHDDLAPAVHSAAEELSAQARLEAEQQARQEIEQARQQAEQARQEASRQAQRGGAAELVAALSSIDRARSQADILNALLQEAGRHASRAAILLLRGGEVRSWAGTGFGDADAALRQVSLGIPGEGSWSHVFQGQGPAWLSSSDCALLCSRIEAPLAHGGILIPMILRDRVAAAIYADRLDGEPIAAEALQVLAYTAALAIESLPFRERTSTATLATLVGEPPAAAEPEPAPDQATDEEPTEVETPVASLTEATEPAEMETATEVPPWVAPLPLPAAGDTSAEALPSIGGWERPAGGSPTFTETEVEIEAEPEPVAASPWTSVEETSPYVMEAVEDTPAEPTAAIEVVEEEESATPTQQVDLRSIQQGQQASPDATVLLQRPNLREVLAPVPSPEPVDDRPAPPPPTPIRPMAPLTPITPITQTAAPAAPPVDDTAPSLPGTPEVRPPSDLQGPGWAFASARVPITPSDEALHEEARRLARLLVSEIKLYNEEQVEEGRRKRDVYERLREDIDRSRQMYEERVEPRILKTTDYFYQELVRILAAGDARALGI
jgi:F0F1-type ATP synthase membrane subunit b/b'